jgi:uncharacterized iron-regulated membrane protein
MSDHVSPTATGGGLYRRVWRWHFFAGLICLPLIFSLATTGALYLFHRQIDDLVYADVLLRAGGGPASLPASLLIRNALQAHPGHVKALTLPDDRRYTAQVDIVAADGVTLQVFVDPATGVVAGALDESSRLMTTIKHLHSLALVGDGGKVVIEIVAGWVVVLVLSGAYLWWPRGRRQGVLAIRDKAAGRVWWRDLHAVSGAYAGVVILFLALTGLPWSIFWGQQVNRWMSDHGLGVPDGMWRNVPKSTQPAADLGALPWNLQQQPVPASDLSAADPHAEHKAASRRAMAGARYNALDNPAAIGVDQAVATLRAAGLASELGTGYRLALPRDERGVYSAIRTPGQLDGQRVVHLDQYSGKVLMDLGAARFGPLGRVTEWGVSVHQGGEYGWPNLLLMLAGCVATMVLCVSGVVMWWRSRPSGRLAAPARRDGDRLARGVVAIAVGAGVIFPLLGASMLAAWLLDSAIGAIKSK